jgi:flotillin
LNGLLINLFPVAQTWQVIMFHVAQANEYLAVTGIGIDGVKVVKKWFQFPGQTLTRFTLTPKSHSLELNAMSLEKLECA